MKSVAISLIRIAAVATLIASFACASPSDEWYFHWNCNGDEECLATNSACGSGPNQSCPPSGTADLGPGQGGQESCDGLVQFAQQFWGAAATYSCDQSSATPPPGLRAITVTPANAAVTIGATQQFTATATYSDGSTADVTGKATWTAGSGPQTIGGPPAVATIDASGLATAAAAGSILITATQGVISGSTSLRVTAVTLISISIAPVNPTVEVGETLQLGCTGSYSDGTTQDLTSSATWTCNPETLATIGAHGLARGVAAGTPEVVASVGSVRGSIALMVTAAPADAGTDGGARMDGGASDAGSDAGANDGGSDAGNFEDGGADAGSDGGGCTPIEVGAWTAAANDTDANSHFASGVINNLFYVTGANVTPAYNDAFDPSQGSTGTWTSKTIMPANLAGAASDVLGGKLLTAGGAIQADDHDYVASLQIYDPQNNSWDTTKPGMPTARVNAAAAAIGGLFYVVGGMQDCAPCDPLGALEVYDPVGNSWSTLAPLPTPRSQLAAAAIGGKLYVIGGQDVGTPSGQAQHHNLYGTLEIYDPVTTQWSTAMPMPTPRSDVAVAVLNGNLYVFGGLGAGSTVLSTAEAYDVCSGGWTTLTSMPTAREGAEAGAIGGDIYVVGGSANGSALGVNEKFTP